MSASAPTAAFEDRLLTFEVGGSVYGLPIACVVEVTESSELACIPTISPAHAGVLNFHGDALPVFRRETLLDLDASELPEPSHVLVVAPRPNGRATLGLCVDRIHGLVAGIGARALGDGPVAERRSVEGRVLFVLDAERLVARAAESIEGSLGRTD